MRIYRKSIAHLRKSIEHLSKIYRKSIEHLLNIYRTSIENLWNGGLLWGYFGSLWGHFEITLELNFGHQDDFGALCEPFRRRQALDGTCDGYMRRLDGAEKWKCWKIVGVCLVFEGQRSPKDPESAKFRSRAVSFDVAKVRFLIRNALCRHLELCFLCRRRAHFQKNNEKIMPKSKTCV